MIGGNCSQQVGIRPEGPEKINCGHEKVAGWKWRQNRSIIGPESKLSLESHSSVNITGHSTRKMLLPVLLDLYISPLLVLLLLNLLDTC